MTIGPLAVRGARALPGLATDAVLALAFVPPSANAEDSLQASLRGASNIRRSDPVIGSEVVILKVSEVGSSCRVNR